MKSPVIFIKTLPHLNSFFLAKDYLTIHTNINSPYTLNFLEEIQVLEKKDINFKKIVEVISKMFIDRVDAIAQKNEFTIKGDVISVWPVGFDHPIRMEFFGDDLEKMYFYDENYLRKIDDIDFLVLSNFNLEDKSERESIKIEFNKDSNIKEYKRIIFSNSLLADKSEDYEIIKTDFIYPNLYYSRFDILEKEIENYKNNSYSIFISTKNIDHISTELVEYTHTQNLNSIKESNVFAKNLIHNIHSANLPAGFISKELKLVYLTDRELFGSLFLTRPERTRDDSNNIKRLLRQFEGNIEIGDYVVHQDYGIGIYSGLSQEDVDGSTMEYLLLTYANNDQLYVPIHQVDKITKFIGPDNVPPKLTKLGKGNWETAKEKVKKTTQILAKELVEHYALREIAKGTPIKKDDSKDYNKFVDEFKFKETEDQQRAINEIINDLEKPIPMNRLLVGDVGFGKTEVFMRGAFKIVENGGQVAVLAPTTILTSQHAAVFKERFKSFPYKVAYLSRFNTAKENQKIIDDINLGKVDIVIGTHRLLSSDVKFKNLQMLIVDEEQRFGVKQKEKIKKLNYGVHVLGVSATPIPRTLSMALSSIQEISIISQPPKDRKPILTEIIKDNWNRATQAIAKEIERGGQVYFVHNEVNTIQSIKQRLETLLPGVKFIVGHGQMSPAELDRVMTNFFNKQSDCLIATTIIENGLDLPNVNTIIINKADHFGLSQLYQLRGRVGRSTREAYCYLMYSGKTLESQLNEQNISDEKLKKAMYRKYVERLQAIVDNQELGSGFRVASRDLEIRGAGSLLGEQQSGFISSIGYAMYIEMLATEVERLRN